MKNWIVVFFIFFSFTGFGQEIVDTAALRVEVQRLDTLGAKYISERKLDDALKVLLQAQEIHQKDLGTETALYAQILNDIGVVNYMNRELKNVEAYWLEAKEIREKVFGKNHKQYASSLNNLAILYKNTGNYKKAEPLYLETLKITEEVDGKLNKVYAHGLNNLAILYMDMGNYQKAEPLYFEAKDIVEKLWGKESDEYATRLNNIAIFYKTIGKYEQAEASYLEGLEIRKRVLSENHPKYGYHLSNLGNLYMEMSLVEKAKPYLIQSKEIIENTMGKDHVLYSRSLSNLSAYYEVTGQYEKAEPMLLEAIAIWKNKNETDHVNYAGTLSNLARLYQNMGNYEKAERQHLEATSELKRVLGENHTDYAQSLLNLARLYLIKGEQQKAEPMFLKALQIREKAVGKEHLDYTVSLISMADFYRTQGNYIKAEPMFKEALEIQKKYFGKEVNYAISLLKLARLYMEMKMYENTESILLESLNIMEVHLGKESLNLFDNLKALADLHFHLGNYKKAMNYTLQVNNLQRKIWIESSKHLSEKELLGYTEKFYQTQNQFLSLNHFNNELYKDAFNSILFQKGFLLTSVKQVSKHSQIDGNSHDIFLRLKGYNRRLANAYSQPLAERDSSSIKNLEEKANALEKELVRTVAGYGDAIRQVNWQEVQTELATGEAALELVNYKFYNPGPTDSVMYAALLLRPGMEQPEFIPLFEAKQLDALLSGSGEEENIALAYNSRSITPKKKKQATKDLYELLWQPLEKHLGGVNKIYYSPSGALHQINFDAIPIGDSTHLSDRYQLSRLGSTRSLVVRDLSKTVTDNAVLFGGIEYEAEPTLAAKGVDTTLVSDVSDSELSFSYAERGLDQRGESWTYLPGTQKEIENIGQLLDQSGFENTVYSSAFASEENFKNIGKDETSPRILHIATHGFFFPDPVDSLQHQGREPVFKISDHPMIRSGLVLAGGNHAWQTGKAHSPGMEDGILTAYEISQMDLSNTELVVLSACETGLGDVDSNEGVYGLQRAFKIAGAKYLIMSLWQVPDQQTQELMTLFYSKWLEDKLEIPQAFRAAQQKMRAKHKNPYLWAGFVLME